MLADILDKLAFLESKHGIKVLYACESGSRAWGFPSTDSDYDVRFIYCFPAAHYLTIAENTEVMGLPVDEVLDFSGWDVRKALRLFRKSNASLYEWLQSPVVYKTDDRLQPALASLMHDYFSIRDGVHHYLGLVKNTFSRLQEEEVKIKKYFYCIRSILAAMWICEKQELPPMEFTTLRTLVTDSEWQSVIDNLLLIKATANEATLVPANPLLHQFILFNKDACEETARKFDRFEGPVEALNELFRTTIHEI